MSSFSKPKTPYTESKKYFEVSTNNHMLLRKPKASWKLVDWVVRYSSLTGNAKLVAAAIASNYNKENGYALISYKKIEAMTGLTEATISRAVQLMKISGEWVVYHVQSDNGYSKWQRYVPLAPTHSLPGNFMSLNPLIKKMNKREMAKNSIKGSNLSLDENYWLLWESPWGGQFLRDFILENREKMHLLISILKNLPILMFGGKKPLLLFMRNLTR